MWLFAQQLGFFYADGALTRVTPKQLVATAATALVALFALTTFGPYPHSMVGLPGERISNMAPPTICLLALTVLQVALVMLLRPALTRWLQREKPWTVVVAGNGVIMTIFLWHLERDAPLGLAAVPARLPAARRWHRGVVDHPPAVDPRRRDPTRRDRRAAGSLRTPAAHAVPRQVARVDAVIASIGTALLAIGISGIATGTLGNLLHGTSRLVLIDITPFQAMTIAATGWLLLRSSVFQEPEARRPGNLDSASGRLAQLEERLPYKQEVVGSSPAAPTNGLPLGKASVLRR